jgi:hypothetical protein
MMRCLPKPRKSARKWTRNLCSIPAAKQSKVEASEGGGSPVGHGDVEGRLLVIAVFGKIARRHVGLLDPDVLPLPAVPHCPFALSDDDPVEASFWLVGAGAHARVMLPDFLLLAVERGVGRPCLDTGSDVDFGGGRGGWERCCHALGSEVGEHGHGDNLLELHCCDVSFCREWTIVVYVDAGA